MVSMNTLKQVCQQYGIEYTGQKVIEIPNEDRRGLARLFAHLGFTSGAEIGVERGIYSKMLLTRIPNLELYGVDPWQAYKGYREHVSQSKLDGFFHETKIRLSDFEKFYIIRDYSVNAARSFADGELDFVYIDGNHEYSHVVADIAAWIPKVKKGGIVAGHDYITRKDPNYLMHVTQAVHGYCDAYQIAPLFVVGRKDLVDGEVRDKPRSWFFIKQ